MTTRSVKGSPLRGSTTGEGEVTSNRVDWISALMDEGAPHLPTRTFPMMLDGAATGSATIVAEAVPRPQPRPLIATPGDRFRQLI
jgi:hypothetical protein